MLKDKLINMRVTEDQRTKLKDLADSKKLTLTQLLLKPFKRLLKIKDKK